jgi:hypothetical protein
MVPRVVTSYTTENFTETVPVTTSRNVVEECGSFETRNVPRIVAGPGCTHGCGHRCGSGCKSCSGNGAGGCPSTTTVMECQQVFVSRPVTRTVTETCYVQQTKTRTVPVHKTVEVPEP